MTWWGIWWRYGFRPIVRLTRHLPVAEDRRERWLSQLDWWACDHIGKRVGYRSPVKVAASFHLAEPKALLFDNEEAVGRLADALRHIGQLDLIENAQWGYDALAASIIAALRGRHRDRPR